jgi:type IV pilus assembly protein PilM
VLPKLFTKKFIGIDIGTSSIRIAEVEKAGQNLRLSNFGQIDIGQIESGMPKPSGRAVAAFSTDEVAEMIQAVLAAAKIKTRQCAFSIPDFSTFFTSFYLPPMTQKELPKAVMFEARQHIPLPIESVTIDWQLVGSGSEASQRMEVTVTAVPNEIIAQYREIAQKAKLEIILMEAEMFGLMRALVPKDEMRPICLIDMGTQSTVCSLIEKRVLRYSHSFDRGGKYLSDEIANRLPVSREMARSIRDNYGLELISMVDSEVREKINDIMKESLMPVFKEVEMMLADYRRLTNMEVAKIILSGGAMAIPQIKSQFADYFKKETQVADPFAGIDCSPEIAADTKETGLDYSVALGMAERGFDYLK